MAPNLIMKNILLDDRVGFVEPNVFQGLSCG